MLAILLVFTLLRLVDDQIQKGAVSLYSPHILRGTFIDWTQIRCANKARQNDEQEDKFVEKIDVSNHDTGGHQIAASSGFDHKESETKLDGLEQMGQEKVETAPIGEQMEKNTLFNRLHHEKKPLLDTISEEDDEKNETDPLKTEVVSPMDGVQSASMKELIG
ncbi:hypothetical protein BLNAU_11636 [Blattamonas nauphoetae]|uniref:Uncharacterized protein n=1 Tax=Blattamonas nauphoetae TaxID=2049346 RepID=A0ABQ9XS36_9EUKA|nr:hypothetical protein BLNAU_11636 [Blattamonas nauphoetae]